MDYSRLGGQQCALDESVDMPDNNPTSWPPLSLTENNEAALPEANTKAGKVSLILAVSLLLVIPAVVFWIIYSGLGSHTPIFFYLLPILFLLSVCGFVFGIFGRRSIPGRIGLSMSVVIMLAILVVWFVFLFITSTPPES
jgi:hypothetical protein